MLEIFKFGGASVKDVKSINNMLTIIKEYDNSNIIIVVSAMGKMTNAFENLLSQYFNGNKEGIESAFENIYKFHFNIINNLFPKNHLVYQIVENKFSEIRNKLTATSSLNYDFEYDQLVSYGEILSSLIIHNYFVLNSLNADWLDIRNIIKSDNTFRDAKVFWKNTETKTKKAFKACFEMKKINYVVTQGFIASSRKGYTTTLGREGSDYTASILGYCLNVKRIVIWKDVAGFLNADPKIFQNTVKLDYISYKDSIELAYYGASIIHPKTIKPLQNKDISLHVKSFLDPKSKGSIISNEFETKHIPCYIYKQNQTLISISPKDFSFINERNIQYIFNVINKYKIKINIMQNSAISFSICIDSCNQIEKFIEAISKKFVAKYNDNLHLYTIKYYDEKIKDQLIAGREVVLEQKSRNTIQLLIKSK